MHALLNNSSQQTLTSNVNPSRSISGPHALQLAFLASFLFFGNSDYLRFYF